MAHAYTPGLKVKKAITVLKTRKLPIPGKVLVKEGDYVSRDTIVAKTEIPGNTEFINVANILGIEPNELPKYMKKKVNDPVEKSEVIAELKMLFGFINKSCKSPIKGTLEFISESTGQAIIRCTPIPVDVRAYIPGKVVKIIPSEGVIIQTVASFIQGIFGIGGETYGELKVLVDTSDQKLSADKIGSECAGKVLVGGSLARLDAIEKAIKVGVNGIIVGGVRDKDIIDILGHEIGVAITGKEDIGLTLITTEGFGEIKMADRTFNLLKSLEGKQTCINGATQIRAGVIRPEIIVPEEGVEESAIVSEKSIEGGMDIGTSVRITRAPYFGAISQVSRLPIELQTVETGSPVRVVEVELEDGRKVIVPRANVEIIEK